MAETEEPAGPGGLRLLPGESPGGDLAFPFRFPLKNPIQSLGEELSALTLKEPTADHGLRYSLYTQGLTDETAFSFLSDLTDVPVGSLKRMALTDMMRIVTILSRFLAQAVR